MNKNKLEFLERGGFRFDSNGSISLSAQALDLYNSFIDKISRILRPYYIEIIRAPPLITKKILNKTGYIDNFSQHLINFNNKLSHLKDSFLTPAACFHIYPLLSNKFTSENKGYLVLSQCGRYEEGKWEFPFRLSSFTMMELVIFGSQEYIDDFSNKLLFLFKEFFVKIGLEGEFVKTTDAFYLDKSKSAKFIQQLKELKKEYRVKFDKNEVALMSINKHERYFSDRFDILLDTKEKAESMCIAFGLERLIAMSLLKWGTNRNKWAKELK